MKKAMISQPMANRSEEEIKNTRDKAIKTLTALGYDVVNTYLLMNGIAKKR